VKFADGDRLHVSHRVTLVGSKQAAFSGSKNFVFSSTDVTFQDVDPALDSTLQDLSIPLAIPDSDVQLGDWHIAYKCADAGTTTMLLSANTYAAPGTSRPCSLGVMVNG